MSEGSNGGANQSVNSRILESLQELNGLPNTHLPAESNIINAARALTTHNFAYTAILNAYKENIVNSFKWNRIFKVVYFFGSVIVMAVLIVIMACLAFNNTDSIEKYVSAAAAFITAFIVLPVTITKYLFNPDESKDLKEIILAMQSNDKSLPELLPDNSKPDSEGN